MIGRRPESLEQEKFSGPKTDPRWGGKMGATFRGGGADEK
jgi:hypothetical protein